MDGVLVDTEQFHYLAWQAVLREAGIPFSRGRFRETFGMNNADMIAALVGEPPDPNLVDTIGENKEQVFRRSIQGKVELLPRAREWLAKLDAWGVRQAVASSAPRENIDTLIGELDIQSHFKVLISGTGMPGKPNPAVFLQSAEALDLPPEACLVIEDSIAGVTAAKRARMRCLAVTTTNPPEKLSLADCILPGLDQLTTETMIFLLNGSDL